MSKISAKELLEVLDNQWADTKDVMSIGCVGQNKALAIMRDIRNTAVQEGYKLSNNLVPMEKVIDYFKINVNYLKKVTK